MTPSHFFFQRADQDGLRAPSFSPLAGEGLSRGGNPRIWRGKGGSACGMVDDGSGDRGEGATRVRPWHGRDHGQGDARMVADRPLAWSLTSVLLA